MADNAAIGVVIVTFNSRGHIQRCLESLADNPNAAALEIMVVDNGSSDDTVDIVATHHPHCELIQNPENLGFAAACNQAIRRLHTDMIMLLNPDAALPAGTLKALVDYLGSHPEVGIVGPRLVDFDFNLQRDHSATGIFPTFSQALYEYTRLHRLFPHHYPNRAYFLTEKERLSNRPVAMVQGACFLFRRRLVDEIGLFDERYFLYFEETDFCKRAHDAGWEIHYVGEVPAIHAGGHSMPKGRQSNWFFIRSLYLYHAKHNGVVSTSALWLILLLNHGLRILRMGAAHRRHPENRKLEDDLRVARERFVSHFFFLRSGNPVRQAMRHTNHTPVSNA